LAFKEQTLASTRSAAQMILQIASDTQLHKDFFTTYGIALKDVESTNEEPELIAFTRYMFDVALTGDDFLLGLALTPCIMGYGEIGMGLKRQGELQDSRHGQEGRIRLVENPYRQ
jgi:thiaminase